MALQIEWTIEGEKQLSRRLRGIEADVMDWKPAFRQATTNLRQTFEGEVFVSRGSAIGESWRPLSPVTIAQKARQGYPTDPLIRTGNMKRSFHSRATSMEGIVWNSATYFKYHQSNKPRSKIPRRVMMKLGENQRQMIVKVFHTQFTRKVKGK